MASPTPLSPLHDWLGALDEDDIRSLLDLAARDVAGLADWLETRRAAASDDPGDLLAIVNRDLAPTRRFYDYYQANHYASNAYDTVQLLSDQAAQATPALIPVIERAITLTTRAILKSDDSSGLQGDLVRTLLDAHATAVRSASPALTQPEQTRLVKWIVKYRYGGTQDFFDPDIVAYAPGLSATSVAQYRKAIAGIDLGESGGYPLRRLAVLDRDRDAIVAASRGEPTNALVAKSLVADLDEAGLHEDAVAYAQMGVRLDSRGWDRTLIDLLVEDAVTRSAADEAVTLRRSWFARFTQSTAFDALRETASHAGVWEDERPDAEEKLSLNDPRGFVRYLLAEDRGDQAWDFATARIDPTEAADVWLNLCKYRSATRPADTLPVYRAILQQTLVVTDKRNYRSAAEILKRMRHVAQSAGADHEAEFTVFLSQVVEQNRRRPTCIAAFRKAKLI